MSVKLNRTVASDCCAVRVDGVRLRHVASSQLFVVRDVVIRESDLEPCLTYFSVGEPIHWCRPAREFFQTDGAGHPRWRWSPVDEPYMEELREKLDMYEAMRSTGSE